MKAVLKKVDFNDNNPENYSPGENGVVLNLTLFIGPEENNEINYFDLFVCSPEYLSKSIWEPRMGKGIMIIPKYDLEIIMNKINECIDKCEGNDWIEVAQKLSRYFDWEFEDYQPSEE